MIDARRRAATLGLLALVAAAALAWLSAPPDAGAEDDATPWSREALAKRFPPPDAKAPADAFGGSELCAECHEDRKKSLLTSFHAGLLDAKKSGSKGCEACHGPGQEHADSNGDEKIRNPAQAPAAETIGVCLTCHADVLAKPVEEHRAWIQKGADLRSCVQCHGIHLDKSLPAFDKSVGPFRDRKALAAVAKPVDAAVCASCHTTFHPEMAKSGHAFLLKDDPVDDAANSRAPPASTDGGGRRPDRGSVTPSEQCAACHGNGSLHALSGGDPRKILRPDRQRPKDADASCMECHRSGSSVARWTCAEHSREAVACVVCHDANAPKGHTLRGSEFELCGGCHKEVQAKFRLPNRHRVAEGRVGCTDCHDPHGNRSRMRDIDVRMRVCGDCHAEKTQPFLFDHGIKRSEGCVACHDPHGSTNRRMLTYARIKPLCLQCHPDTPHPLNQTKYDNCISCHSEIHGSDLQRTFRR